MRIYEMMNEAVQCSFDGGDLSSQLTRRLMAHVAQADHREGLACALAGNEEYFAESLALQLCLFRTLFSVVSGDFFPDVAGSSRREIAAKLIYEDVMTRLTSAGRLPYYGATLELKQPRTCLGGLPQSLIHSERYLRACMAQACHEARLDLMQLGILIEQYKERTGSLPATLEALAPQLAGSLPVDPFSGRSYHYRPSGGSFVIYSVGLNLRDDGGTAYSSNVPDLVWRGHERR